MKPTVYIETTIPSYYCDKRPEIAQYYEECELMPRAPVRDALHVAIASYYRIEYLLTWNCRHLANIRKIRHLELVNQKLGLSTPILLTPAMLQL